MEKSKSLLASIAKILAIIAAVLVVITLSISMLSNSLSRVLFSPEIMTNMVADVLADSDFVQDWLISQIMEDEWFDDGSNTPLSLNRAIMELGPEERRELIEMLLPSDWIRDQVIGSINVFYRWVFEENEQPKILIDLDSLSASMDFSKAEDAANLIISTWPLCTPQQLLEFSISEGDVQFACRPAEPALKRDLVNRGAFWLVEEYHALPPEILLLDNQGDAQMTGDLVRAREMLRLVHAIMQWSWLAPVILMGLIMALIIRSWRELGLWWGIPLLSSGLLIIPIALITPAFMGKTLFQLFLEQQWPMMMDKSMLMAFFYRIVSRSQKILLVRGLIIAIAGGLLLALGLTFGSSSKSTGDLSNEIV